MSTWCEKLTFGQALDRAVERFGAREALMFQGQRWTFAQLQADCDRAARALIQAGVRPGDKVSLWLMNRPEFVHLIFAVAKIGAVLVPANTRFRTRDIEYLLRQSDSTTLITADRSGPIDYLAMVRELLPDLPSASDPRNLQSAAFPELRRVIVLSDQHYPGALPWNDLLRAGEAVPPEEFNARQRAVNPDDTAIILYTSGTTGFPKGVMHNHDPLRIVMDHANRLAVRPQDVVLMYLPLFHSFGLHEGPWMSMVSGARVVLMEQFDAGEALRLIESEKASLIHGFDTHFRDLMDHPDCLQTDRSSLRTGLLAAGLASSEATARHAQQLLCHTVSCWGMTEVGAGATLGRLTDTDDERCTRSGVPLPGYDYKVVDPETGKPVPFGTPGELLCRGYGVMQGYYQKPEETAKVLDADGWFRSGDMCILYEDETIRFLGRFKDMLKVGGENVDPAEVEALLLSHPAVSRVVVVGVPDPRLSEVACACVVLQPGAEGTATPPGAGAGMLEALTSHLRGQVASFKIPRHVVVVDELPMTASGKIQKFKLREICLQQLGLS